MIFGLFVTGLVGYGSYKGAKGMWASANRWNPHWSLVLVFWALLIISPFAAVTYLFYM